MVIVSLPVEILDEICGGVQRTKILTCIINYKLCFYCKFKRIFFFPNYGSHPRVHYLILVHHTSKRALIVVDSWKINSSSQTADIPESTDLEEGKTIAEVDKKCKSEWLNSQELEGSLSLVQCL